MNQNQAEKPLDRLIAKSAAEASARARLSDDARALLAEGLACRQYLDQLVESRLATDAVQFLAQALPKREAVWWASLCVDQVLGPEPEPTASAALEAARAWVIDPTDENRRATFPAAEAADIGTPAGCTAAAAYFSGGSLAPAHLTAVPPPDYVTAQLVASALTLAAVVKDPEKAGEKSASFLQIGLEIASGGSRWPESSPESTATTPKPEEPMSERDRRIAEMRARRARR